MKKLLAFLLVVIFVAAGCSTTTVEENETTETDSAVAENSQPEENKDKVNGQENQDSQDTSEEGVSVDVEVNFLPYENKAIGYKILIPENWYWRHFMKNEIKAAEKDELIDDYLVVDKDVLTGLGSEYLGQIVLEVSRFDLDSLKEDKKNYSSKDVTVADMSATRFETTSSDGDKIIEYHLKKNNATVRLMYVSDENDTHEAMFEKMVDSFSF